MYEKITPIPPNAGSGIQSRVILSFKRSQLGSELIKNQ